MTDEMYEKELENALKSIVEYAERTGRKEQVYELFRSMLEQVYVYESRINMNKYEEDKK